MHLPSGYTVERDPDILILYAPNGEVVARFGPGVDPEEVEREAEDHRRTEDHRELAVAVLIGLALGLGLGWGAGL